MDRLFTISDVRKALAISGFNALQAQLKMTPTERPVQRPSNRSGEVRLGGVLALLFVKNSELHLILTRRHDGLNSHAGQISFPGGRREGEETLLKTALRETEEEIGVTSNRLKVLGHLSTLYIPPSDFEVHPFVAWLHEDDQPGYLANPDEVAEIIEEPLVTFFDPLMRNEEPWNFQGLNIMVPYYKVGNHKVWGATAMMISELVERLRYLGT